MSKNIKPCWWGSHIWQTIFFMVSVYPSNPSTAQIESMRGFFKGLKCLLPCEGCMESYNKLVLEPDTSIDNIDNFTSRGSLIIFVYNLRNKINIKLTHEYYVDLNYFKKKLDHMITSQNYKYDGKTCEMIEAPYIPKSLEKKALKYLKANTTHNITNHKKILELMKQFMSEPNFDYENKLYKFAHKRNHRCRKIIKKIYNCMSEGDYDLVESFSYKDRELHEMLLFLGCTILHKENLEYVLDKRF